MEHFLNGLDEYQGKLFESDWEQLQVERRNLLNEKQAGQEMLVTGALGFVGTLLAERFARKFFGEGSAKVVSTLGKVVSAGLMARGISMWGEAFFKRDGIERAEINYEEDKVNRRQVYYMFGDTLDIDDFKGESVLRNGQLIKGDLEQKGDVYFISIVNAAGGGVSYVVDKVTGRAGVARQIRKIQRHKRDIERVFGSDGPPGTWQSPGGYY